MGLIGAAAVTVKPSRSFTGTSSPRSRFQQNQFVMVVTAGRISRITDYGCKQTAPLFGDLATATILSPIGSQKYPVHFELVRAGAGLHVAERVFFDYHVQENVPLPTPNGGRRRAARRLVFSLDGLGIADAAPRVMASTTAKAIQGARIRPEEVQFLVPHQAGTGIVRFTEMKLEEIGVRGEVINGLTRDVGNVSFRLRSLCLTENLEPAARHHRMPNSRSRDTPATPRCRKGTSSCRPRMRIIDCHSPPSWPVIGAGRPDSQGSNRTSDRDDCFGARSGDRPHNRITPPHFPIQRFKSTNSKLICGLRIVNSLNSSTTRKTGCRRYSDQILWASEALDGLGAGPTDLDVQFVDGPLDVEFPSGKGRKQFCDTASRLLQDCADSTWSLKNVAMGVLKMPSMFPYATRTDRPRMEMFAPLWSGNCPLRIDPVKTGPSLPSM